MFCNYDLCFKTPQKKWIYVPSNECRSKGQEFCELILKKWSPPSYFYHFRSGGHIAALKYHQNKKYFAKLDIQRFFPNITKSKLFRALKSIRISPNQSQRIAKWSSVKSKENPAQRILPYGFVQSQLIAAVCMDVSALGKAFRNLPPDIKISVYVDDIIISGNNKKNLQKAYKFLISAAAQANFLINETKSHPPQIRTSAFNIDFEKSQMKISEERFDEFLGEISLINDKKTEAIISYVDQVSSSQAEILNNVLTEMSTRAP